MGSLVVRAGCTGAIVSIQARGEGDTMKNLILHFVREDEGQDLVEYALLITFIALACIIGMQQLGTAINNKYQTISSSLATGS
jgi:pilus assembly protein Flp/PilA